MRGLRLWFVATAALGGGGLLLFAWFLLAGPPLALGITRSPAMRLGWDAGLCAIFFVQHSGMVRRGAKARLARRLDPILVPALYSVASGAALGALVLLWLPVERVLFEVDGAARWSLYGLFAAAVAGFAWGARALGSFDPFGTVALAARMRGITPPPVPFMVLGPYRYVRHPLYACVLLMIWASPRVTLDRLLFDVLWTAWIVAGTILEERDLVAQLGEDYRRYQRLVPMLLPMPRFHIHA